MLSRLFGKIDKRDYVQVFSHPRSGTHLMEAFLARNFYHDQELSIKPITWGHWSNRKIKKEGNVYGQLFGSHSFPKKKYQKLPLVYIYRDGRAVANSIWKTDNFLNEHDSSLSFNQFLKLKLDWIGSPACKSSQTNTIAEHWLKHVSEWHDFVKNCPMALTISYEDVLSDPVGVYLKIHKKFFPQETRLCDKDIDSICDKRGIYPNSANSYSWRENFTEDDLELFDLQLNFNKLYLSEKKTILY